MNFVSGMLLIDAPASALNNSGEDIPGARTENTSSVKFIRAKDGTYPYVSAQAFRYWLRNTLEASEDLEWKASLIVREDKVAYTDANPLLYWDDDLLGYMRAPSKKKKDQKDQGNEKLTPMEEDEKGNPKPVTRASPFRVSTLVSLTPVNITADFGVMARHEGDPTPFEHQFYRTVLHGLFSIDLNMVGKFYYRRRTGFQNLDAVRRKLAEKEKLEHLESEKAYRLSASDRVKRIQSLLKGIGRLQGGAKQTLHYTDVSPAVSICAVVKGGNHPFNYLFSGERDSLKFNRNAFVEALTDIKGNLLSPIWIGWKPGFSLSAQQMLDDIQIEGVQLIGDTPHGAFDGLAQWIAENPEVLR